jgi:hypothetical protein
VVLFIISKLYIEIKEKINKNKWLTISNLFDTINLTKQKEMFFMFGDKFGKVLIVGLIVLFAII